MIHFWGIPSNRLIFFWCYIFLSGVQGKYVKAYLSDFVRIFHWLLLTPQRRQPLTHSQTLDPNQCNRQVKKPSRAYFPQLHGTKKSYWNDTKNGKSSTWTYILVAVSRLYTHCYLNLPIQNGDETFKAPNLHLMWQDSVALAAIRDMLAWSGKPKKSKALEFFRN